MLTEILESNKSRLLAANSYLHPYLDRMIHLFRKLEESNLPEITTSIKHSAYSKGDYLIQEGKPCRYLWLIESGQLRMFRRKGSEEPTLYFYFPGEPVMLYSMVAPLAIASASVQFITNGTVYAIPCSSLQKLRITYPGFADMEILTVEGCRHMLEDRVFNLLFTEVHERYQNLLENHPLWVQTLKVTYLADYMGVQLETVSRVRGKRKGV